MAIAKTYDLTDLDAAAGEIGADFIRKFPALFRAAESLAGQKCTLVDAKFYFALRFPTWAAHQAHFANAVVYLQAVKEQS